MSHTKEHSGASDTGELINSPPAQAFLAASAAAVLIVTTGCAPAPTTTMAQTATAQPATLSAPMARFSEEYKAAHRGQVRIQVPEVYELVNVAIALTPFAQEHPSLVLKDTPYFRQVVNYFGPVKDHPLIRALDEQLRADLFRYRSLKMNGYAFEYRGDEIVPSPVYMRTSHPDDLTNDLLTLLPMLQDFSDESRFKEFYAANAPLYREQEEYLRTAVGAEEMMAWLRANFPEVRAYDTSTSSFLPLWARCSPAPGWKATGFVSCSPTLACAVDCRETSASLLEEQRCGTACFCSPS